VRRLISAIVLAVLGPAAAAQAQQVFSAYTSFDADKTCKHTPGREVEDYGSERR
jgi:hypothetical protein